MNNCKEFVLDDLMAVTAVPVTDFNIGPYAWQLSPVIDSGDFSPILINAVTVGLLPAEPGGALVPIRHGSGKVKDEEQDSVAGRLHTVTVSCEIDDRDTEVLEHLLTLERVPAHLLLVTRSNERFFVAATEDTYLCTAERDGSRVTVSFRVQNIMGLQFIV